MSLQIAITTEIHDINIEDRIIINAPAERIFGHVFNVEHQRLAEYCEPSVIAGASQNLFFRRALLKLFRRLQLGSEFIRFDLTDITPFRTVTFSPTHWSGRLYLSRISFEFDELAGRTEVISRIFLRFGFLERCLNRRGMDRIRYALTEHSESLKNQIEQI